METRRLVTKNGVRKRKFVPKQMRAVNEKPVYRERINETRLYMCVHVCVCGVRARNNQMDDHKTHHPVHRTGERTDEE